MNVDTAETKKHVKTLQPMGVEFLAPNVVPIN